MPRQQPVVSWTQIRSFAEQFRWQDKSGVWITGVNPPGGADGKGVERVPYHVKYITGKGVVEQGYVVTLKVGSRQIRRIRDYLIMEINGVRIVTH